MDINIAIIDEIDDPRIVDFRGIRERDLRKRDNLFIAEGKVVLSVLLRSKRYQTKSILVAENRLPSLRSLFDETRPQCPVYCAPQAIIDTIAGFHLHRGILAIGQRTSSESVEEFFGNLPSTALVPVCCGISNHDNIGAIFRNAAAFGANGVVLDETCCDPLYRKAIRVSVGAALMVPYCKSSTIDNIVRLLDKYHFDVYALSPRGAHCLRDVRRSSRVALLLGAEGEGLPPLILRQITNVRIPIAANFDSLNVATAAGIALSHFSPF